MQDTVGNAALEPVENMLADGLDGDRSSGEMLMECVVKVRHYIQQEARLESQNVRQDADCPASLQCTLQIEKEKAVWDHDGNLCIQKQLLTSKCAADLLCTLRTQLFLAMAAQAAV